MRQISTGTELCILLFYASHEIISNEIKKRTYNDNKLTGKGWFDFPDWI